MSGKHHSFAARNSRRNFSKGILMLLLLGLYLTAVRTAAEASGGTRGRVVPDPYYPQKPTGELRLNYYYDRTGRWVKFSDWIPYQQNKHVLRFAEDFYEAYGLNYGYRVNDLKESIFFLYKSLDTKFRHPRNALTKIKTPEEYHKYRLLFQMHVYMLIMRMHLRLGSLYDKRHLYFHDLDFSDDLEISFLIARTYYNESRKYWEKARELAHKANEYPFELDMGTIETERFEIVTGKLDYDRIIDLHTARVEAKLEHITAFLNEEGRPRPVKTAIQKDLEKMYDDRFTPDPLGPPVMKPHFNEKPLHPDNDEFFKMPPFPGE